MATDWTLEVRKKLATVMATNWTLAVRQRLGKDFPPDQVLPDKQPSYVRSAVYLFGALTIASFAIIIVTGTVLAILVPSGGIPMASATSSIACTCGVWKPSFSVW